MSEAIVSSVASIAVLERAVVGAIFFAQQAEEQRRLIVDLQLDVDHFQSWDMKLGFWAICDVLERSLPINQETLEHTMIARGTDPGRAQAIITEMAIGAVSSASAYLADYAREIRLAALNRKAIEMLAENLERARRWPHDAAELVSETRGELERLESLRPSTRTYHTTKEIVEGLRAFSRRAWIPFQLGGEVIDQLPLGESLFLTGASGSGKSTLAFSLGAHHAKVWGPTLIVSRELTEVTAAARVGAIQTQQGWSDVLTGSATEQAIAALLDLPRLVFLDGKRAGFDGMRRAIRELKIDFPGQAIMLVVDYVQLLRVPGTDMRSRVADAIELLRDLVQDELVLGLMLSQMSREKADAARKGGRLGIDTMNGGAESAAIEQAAALTAEIGQRGPLQGDGSCDLQLSIGKHRYGGGDRVLDLRQWGSSGLTRVLRDRPASEVREQMQRTRDDAVRQRTLTTVLEAASASGVPMTRKELLEAAGVRHADGRVAIAALIASGGLVELAERRRHSTSCLVWTRERAREAGKPLRQEMQ